MSAGWQALRATDRDLALALLFAPGASRELIADRMSLAIEAETALKLASEPMLAAIRLQWWVEAIEQGSGGSVPLMQRLQRHLDSGAATPVALASQIGIWQDRLATAPEANPETTAETTPETTGACWAEFFGSLLPAQEQAARQVGRALVDSDARVGDEALGILARDDARWAWMIGLLARHRQTRGGSHDDPLMAWWMLGWRLGVRRPSSPTTSR
ncbi:MAG: hypothetical protein VX073_06225 [Pseudomonadota bacterium]|nr:hypothetical protein [Pseudomonadota bacterium]